MTKKIKEVSVIACETVNRGVPSYYYLPNDEVTREWLSRINQARIGKTDKRGNAMKAKKSLSKTELTQLSLMSGAVDVKVGAINPIPKMPQPHKVGDKLELNTLF